LERLRMNLDPPRPDAKRRISAELFRKRRISVEFFPEPDAKRRISAELSD